LLGIGTGKRLGSPVLSAVKKFQSASRGRLSLALACVDYDLTEGSPLSREVKRLMPLLRTRQTVHRQDGHRRDLPYAMVKVLADLEQLQLRRP